MIECISVGAGRILLSTIFQLLGLEPQAILIRNVLLFVPTFNNHYSYYRLVLDIILSTQTKLPFSYSKGLPFPLYSYIC